MQESLKAHAPDGELSYVSRADVGARRAYSALTGINRHPRKRCRKELARAFLEIFSPSARFDLLRTDKPHGVGLLAIDKSRIGVLFVELHAS